jgi:hypothetical protein
MGFGTAARFPLCGIYRKESSGVMGGDRDVDDRLISTHLMELPQ